MQTKAEKNKIAPSGLFFIIFISRLTVCLTSIHSVSGSELKSDVLISYIISLLLCVLTAIPILYCVKLGKNPLDVKTLSFFYFLYFSFAAAVGTAGFSYFASTVLSPQTSAWIFALALCVCSYYAVRLGIEAISRFSAFCFALIIIAVSAVILCNIKNYNEINLYPLITSDKISIMKNALIYTSNTFELAIFLCISKRVNGNTSRAFIRAVSAAYITAFILMLFIIAVMGDNAAVQSFPFYKFFQISKFTDFERLDVLHISFWIMGIFVKAAAAIYCCVYSLGGSSRSKRCLIGVFTVFIISLFILKLTFHEELLTYIKAALFIVFCVIIPVFTLILKKKNNGDELVKMF